MGKGGCEDLEFEEKGEEHKVHGVEGMMHFLACGVIFSVLECFCFLEGLEEEEVEMMSSAMMRISGERT